jgi:hypothetical protein
MLRLFGANGLFIQLDLGLLSDVLGPLRSCFDFRDVILCMEGVCEVGTKIEIITEVMKRPNKD